MTTDPARDAAPTRSRPRLDVILIGIGLVLLILGALLILVQSDAFPRALIPGSSAPVPPRRPSAGPKPGVLVDGIPAIVDLRLRWFAASPSA